MLMIRILLLGGLAFLYLNHLSHADNRQGRYGHIEVQWDGPRSGKFRVTPNDELSKCSQTTNYIFNVISRDNTICSQAFGSPLKHMDWPIQCYETPNPKITVNFPSIHLSLSNRTPTATEWANFACN